jgi:hypothetical protein
MLERCDRCGQVADKYLEFEENLKTLSMLLCAQSVYRHLFFNINFEKIRLSYRQMVKQCAVMTVLMLACIYWSQNRMQMMLSLEESKTRDLETITADLHPEIEYKFMSMHHIQWTNLRLLY